MGDCSGIVRVLLSIRGLIRWPSNQSLSGPGVQDAELVIANTDESAMNNVLPFGPGPGAILFPSYMMLQNTLSCPEQRWQQKGQLHEFVPV